MATTVDTSSVTVTPAVNPASSDTSGESTLHGVKGSSYGSFAAATMQIATMMTTLNNLMNKNAIEQTQFGQEFNESQCKATIAEGWSNAKSHLVQAGTSFATAAISAGTLYFSSDSELSAQRDQAQAEVNALKAKQEPVRAGANEPKPLIVKESKVTPSSDPAATNPVTSRVTDDAKVDFEVSASRSGTRSAEARPDQDDGLDLDGGADSHAALRSQFLRKNFTGEQDADDIRMAVSSAGNKAGEIEQELSRQIEHKEKVVNTLQSQISSKENTYRIFGDLAKGVAEAGGQLGQAHYTLQAAQERAAGTGAQFNQQLSAQTAQAVQKTIADNWNYLSTVLNALTQVVGAAA